MEKSIEIEFISLKRINKNSHFKIVKVYWRSRKKNFWCEKKHKINDSLQRALNKIEKIPSK